MACKSREEAPKLDKAPCKSGFDSQTDVSNLESCKQGDKLILVRTVTTLATASTE